MLDEQSLEGGRSMPLGLSGTPTIFARCARATPWKLK